MPIGPSHYDSPVDCMEHVEIFFISRSHSRNEGSINLDLTHGHYVVNCVLYTKSTWLPFVKR